MRQHAGWLVAAAAICALFAGSALSGPTTPAAVNGGVYNSTPPTLSDQQTGVFQLDSSGNLKTAGSTTITNPTIGAAVPATGNYVAGNQGGLLTGITLDASSYLQVNCKTGCSGGSFNNNADNVATSATNGQSAAWLYAWDGSAWDRLYNGPGTEAQALRVTLPTDGTGVVIAKQATAASLNATVVGTGTFVTQSVVTQATASSLNAAVVGNTAAGGADSGNPVKTGGKYNLTFPTLADGNRGDMQQDSRGNARSALCDSSPICLSLTQGNADDQSAAGIVLPAIARNQIFDGTAWDRSLEVVNGANTTGAGIQAIGQMGQCDDTSPQLITENQFGNVLIDCTNHSQVIGGLVTTAAPSYSTATSRGVSLTTAGGLRTDMSTVAGTTTDTNSGNKSAGTQRVVLATDQPALTNKLLVTPDSVALPANQSVNVSQINAVTPLMGNGTTGTGSLRVTLASDNSTLTNTIGNVGEVPVTSGGLSISTLTLANSTNATNVKGSAGQLYSISGFNMSSATPVWISLYNNAGTPTCGTSIVYQVLIPGSTTGAGFVFAIPPGIAFGTGIAFCATTGIAGTGAVAASTYVVNFGYK